MCSSCAIFATTRKSCILIACLHCAVQGRRLQASVREDQSSSAQRSHKPQHVIDTIPVSQTNHRAKGAFDLLKELTLVSQALNFAGGFVSSAGPIGYRPFLPAAQQRQSWSPSVMLEDSPADMDMDAMEATALWPLMELRGSKGSEKMAGPREPFQVQTGMIVEGVVVKLKEFGAEVDIGMSLTAMLPLTKISSDNVSSAEDVLSVGQTIKAIVVDFKIGQICLSTKALEPEPGDMIKNPELVFERAEEMGDKYLQKWNSLRPGVIVEGVVSSITDASAFIEIGLGNAAKLPANEISSDVVSDVTAVLSVGSRIKAMVEHKTVTGSVGLSTKRLEPEPGDRKSVV